MESEIPRLGEPTSSIVMSASEATALGLIDPLPSGVAAETAARGMQLLYNVNTYTVDEAGSAPVVEVEPFVVEEPFLDQIRDSIQDGAVIGFQIALAAVPLALFYVIFIALRDNFYSILTIPVKEVRRVLEPRGTTQQGEAILTNEAALGALIILWGSIVSFLSIYPALQGRMNGTSWVVVVMLGAAVVFLGALISVCVLRPLMAFGNRFLRRKSTAASKSSQALASIAELEQADGSLIHSK